MYSNRQIKYAVREWKPLIEKSVHAVLSNEPVFSVWQKDNLQIQVSVSFVGPRSIRKLNREFRDIDKTTDVLSFPMVIMDEGGLVSALAPHDFEYTDNGNRVLNLGDIVLNVEQTVIQAKEYGHDVEREISFLIVHSMLHLLGYDHIVKDQKIIMEAKQKCIMKILKIER